MKKPARTKRAKKSIKVTVRVLRESALKALETNTCTITHTSKK
ncbi:hypothetical protein [Archangium lansingense]|uniref:Uncharacterized protein n=1 Tax=Archangium lansingense TaxID=2995310 RepID=A0ABT4AGD6_9BACT|nr:hypothetical protein [Archangium lansinium]MCY1080735.1 hypothetical protein [Archangium lansinium]